MFTFPMSLPHRVPDVLPEVGIPRIDKVYITGLPSGCLVSSDAYGSVDYGIIVFETVRMNGNYRTISEPIAAGLCDLSYTQNLSCTMEAKRIRRTTLPV